MTTDFEIRPTVAMHLVGSRHFGPLRPQSDWDAIYQDSPEVRTWLVAAGFVECSSHPLSIEHVSYWRHATYCCECFTVKSEQRRRVARALLKHSYIFWLIRSKPHRKRLWWALERCIEELHEVVRDWRASRAKGLAEGARLRIRPLRSREKNPDHCCR